MKAELMEFIANILGIAEEDLEENMTFKGDLSLDSLKFRDLLTEIEDEYDIYFEEARTARLNTVEELIQEVESLV